MISFNEYHEAKEDFDASLEIINFEQEVLYLTETKKGHHGKEVSEKKKSEIVKRARRGENIFGGKFKDIEEKVAKEYGNKESGKRVAAAIMWKKVKGKHMTKEDTDDLLWIIEDDLQVILDHAIKTQEQLLTEKWKKDVEVKHTGENTDKSVSKLKGEVKHLKGKKGNKKKMGGLLFALRAKEGRKKGEGSTGLPKD